MALKHKHPRISNANHGSELSESAFRWTSDIDVPLAEQPEVHFERLLARSKAFGSGRTGAIRGKYLEIVIYDFVAKVVDAAGGDVSTIRVNVDMRPGHNAEADILVNDRAALLIKTSYRERWKQVDRDSLLMLEYDLTRKHSTFKVWSLFYKEQDFHTLEQTKAKAINVERYCVSNVKVATIIDHEAMGELAKVVRWAVSK